MDKYEIVLSEDGYYRISNPPDQETLRKYYQDKYWQEVTGHRRPLDSLESASLSNSLKLKKYAIDKFLTKGRRNFLDIGSGEGHTLQYFEKEGWNVTGLDFSDFGIKNHYPNLLPKLITGDIYESIDNLIQQKKTFDLIVLDNVLEHVLSPVLLLKKIKDLLAEGKCSGLLIKVPNDFSDIQLFLSGNKMIDREYWLAPPDHLNYFNTKNLESFLLGQGFTMHVMYTDWPIEINLLNQRTNYVNDKSAGKEVYRARLMAENLVAENSIENVFNFYEAAAKINIGRTITALFSPV